MSRSRELLLLKWNLRRRPRSSSPPRSPSLPHLPHLRILMWRSPRSVDQLLMVRLHHCVNSLSPLLAQSPLKFLSSSRALSSLRPRGIESIQQQLAEAYGQFFNSMEGRLEEQEATILRLQEEAKAKDEELVKLRAAVAVRLPFLLACLKPESCCDLLVRERYYFIHFFRRRTSRSERRGSPSRTCSS